MMIFFFESPGSLKFHGGIGPKAAGHKLHQLSYMEGIHGIHSFYLQGRHKENSSGNGLCTASVNIAGVNSKKKTFFANHSAGTNGKGEKQKIIFRSNLETCIRVVS